MTPQTTFKIELLKQLANYEAAYKRAIAFLNVDSHFDDCNGLVRLDTALAVSAKFYKQKIKEIRNKLEET